MWKRVIGNFFIICSLVLLGYTYYPFLRVYAVPPPEIPNIEQQFAVEIPKIKAEAIIEANVDAWNKVKYEQALKKGVAHAAGTALPEEHKTMFLFAHSFLPPWEMTRANTAFLRLGELNIGDEIKIYKDRTEYRYRVVEKREVWPNQTEFLNDLNKDQLILQTCTPVGTDLRRLLVFAEPVS